MRLRKRLQMMLVGFLVIFILAVTCSPLSGLEPPYSLEDTSFYRVENVYYLKNAGNSNAEDITLEVQLVNEYLTKNMPYSTLLSSQYYPEPDGVVIDEKGNRTGIYRFSQLKPGEERTIRLVYYYRVAGITYNVNPELIGPYLPVIRALAPYLNPSPGIECQDPLIINKATELTRGETNPYEKARIIFNFINTHMRYAAKEGDSANRGALAALKTGVGVCEDYSDLFAALLRAAGIPCRTVTGWMGKVDTQVTVMDKTGVISPGHIWVEYYLPNYGWIGADPTYTYLNKGVSQVDYRRLTGLPELRYVEYSESEEPLASYSYYGGKIEVYPEIKVTRSLQEPPVDLSHEPVTLYLEGIPLIFDVEPLIVEGRTMVPLRGIFSVVGAKVDWDDKERMITISSAGRTIILKIGDSTAWVNGHAVTLDTCARIVGNRTVVPLRFIGETLGLVVDWDGKMKTINLKIQ